MGKYISYKTKDNKMSVEIFSLSANHDSRWNLFKEEGCTLLGAGFIVKCRIEDGYVNDGVFERNFFDSAGYSMSLNVPGKEYDAYLINRYGYYSSISDEEFDKKFPYLVPLKELVSAECNKKECESF